MKKIKFRRWHDPILSKEELFDDEERQPIILTPYGFTAPKLHGGIKNNLKFYVGHTNFDLGEREKNIIEDTPGINMMDIFSPYIFKFNVGEMFPAKAVMRALRDRLCGKINTMMSRESLVEVYSKQLELKEKGLYGIYVLPNGNFDFFETSSEKEYSTKLDEYFDMQSEVGGEVLYG